MPLISFPDFSIYECKFLFILNNKQIAYQLLNNSTIIIKGTNDLIRLLESIELIFSYYRFSKPY